MKKNYTTIALIAFFIIGGAFYRYEYRPSKIKQRCSAEARFDQRAIGEGNDIKRQEFIDTYYNDCLMRFGLK